MKRFPSLILAFAVCLAGCGSPQIGVNPEAFEAIDALYTAVSLHDAKLVETCEANLKKLRDDKKLPEAAGKTLDDIIARTRDTKWEDAQTRLGDFMRGQRR